MPPYRSVRRSGYGRVPRGGGAVRNFARGMGYAWRNRRAVVKAGRAVGKGIRNWFGSNQTTTAQRDIRTSKAPRKKRPSKRFTKRVENVISQHAGKNTVVFQGVATDLTAAAGAQAFGFFTLFGGNGSSGANSDLAHMLQFHEDAADIEDPESKNLYYNYGLLDVVFTNRDAANRVYVDIYEWKVRRNLKIFTSPSALYNSNVLDEDLLTNPLGPIQQVLLTQLGVTPYQIPDLCKNLLFGKKTTIQLGPLGTSNYLMARRKNKWVTGLKVRDSGTFAHDGWTEGLLFLVRGAPGSGTSAVASAVDFMNVRKYCWRAMDPDAKNEYLREVW